MTTYAPIQMSSEIHVELIDSMASDEAVIQAAQVSLDGVTFESLVPRPAKESKEPGRFINHLMKMRHGSCFEHTAFKFGIEAPIFVIREWQRHRISSFNEMSGRYTKLQPKFYTPAPDRKMINVGTSARPKMEAGTDAQRQFMDHTDFDAALMAWEMYQDRLAMGISNELARTILPLNIYTQMYWTVNARSLMNFLSLRIEDDANLVPTHPQWEIQLAAEKVEKIFAEKMPHTWRAFQDNGRVAP